MTATIEPTSGDTTVVPAPWSVDDFLERAAADDPHPEAHPETLPNTFVGWLTTTDHKAIGIAYCATALVFLLIGGALAGMMRAELATPGLQIVDEATYNSLFTIHGSVMVYLFAVPFAFGLSNYLVPLQIGAPDMAFPRLNALSYWLFLFAGVTMLMGFAANGGAASFGWFAYAPLSGPAGSPGLGADLWIMAIVLSGTSGTLSAINIITTVSAMRAPGMTMFRMPILVWDFFFMSVMVLVAFPVLSGAMLMLESDRIFGTHIFDPNNGGSAVLWQHLFWFFGHPEVYIVALPFFGVVTEIFPVFARRPVFGYKGLVIATLAIATLSTSVWAHHMFVTGEIVLPFFAATTMLIAVPTGMKVFNWIGSMWGGSISFEPPMVWALGFLVTFIFGGLTGVMLASPSLDFDLSDTYFVVAHFHYVMGGTVVYAVFAAIHFWWPKVTGRMLSKRLSNIHFWMVFIGFNTTFFVMHVLGRRGMPRRVADYPANEGLDTLNIVASIGWALMALSFIPFVIDVITSLRKPATAPPDPWGGYTLEWATTSPPPAHNFTWLPPIRSERPVYDLRWMADENLGNPAAQAAWDVRRGHDPCWRPRKASDLQYVDDAGDAGASDGSTSHGSTSHGSTDRSDGAT